MGGKGLPVEVQQQIISKTDGVPLFVEELTKMVVESGLLREVEGHYELTGPLPPLAIPTTLHDSLMARLDRLATIKEVAQLGATVGREFSYELLLAVSSVEEASLQQALGKLVEAEVLYQRGLPPQAHYLFKHALIQDAAYQSLLKSTRQQYHQRIAQVLAERFAETIQTQPELVAHHYTEAGLIPQALPFWQQAGERAVQRSANIEAISHLSTGLKLLKALPDTPEHVQQELTLQLTLGEALQVTKGYAVPEAKHTYDRARALCQQVGETPQLFPLLGGLWAFYVNRGELQTARELGEQLLTLAQRLPSPAPPISAHHALGTTLFCLGEIVLAREHFERSITLADHHPHDAPPLVMAACLSLAAFTLWMLGYPDQALKRSQEALALVQERPHPFPVVVSRCYAALFYQYRREWQAAQEQAEAAITLATEQGFPHWLAWGTCLRGRILVEQGQAEEGIVQIREGLAFFQAMGSELTRPHFLGLLAQAYGKNGQREEGLRALAEALEVVHETGERVREAELMRLKGELTLQAQVSEPRATVAAEAEVCFHKAIDIARRQSAKSWELRAVISLSRLWQQQGKQKEARQILAEIYGWFTEGFDTKDLQEAKVLLDELN
jgi:predicted ATPase